MNISTAGILHNGLFCNIELSNIVYTPNALLYLMSDLEFDIFQLFESSGINLMADSQYNGETRVQVLLEYLQVLYKLQGQDKSIVICLKLEKNYYQISN